VTKSIDELIEAARVHAPESELRAMIQYLVPEYSYAALDTLDSDATSVSRRGERGEPSRSRVPAFQGEVGKPQEIRSGS
jgi:hypothetical protein